MPRKFSLTDQEPYNFVTRTTNKILRHITVAGSTSDTYSYTPLRVENDEIRTFQLLPGEHYSPICISIATVGFTDRDVPEYEAISYTWGNADKLAVLHVVHEDRKSALRVSKNCEQALRFLRLRDRARTLWLDAICINQTDLQERARQVSLMYSVYSNATKVTAWLGPQSKTSPEAMGWISLISQKVAYDTSTYLLVGLTDDPIWTEFGSTAAMSAEQFHAVTDFVARPWFSRLWIWQEIRSNKDRAFLRCGAIEIPWTRFCAAMGYLTIKSTSSININPQQLSLNSGPLLPLATPRQLQPLEMLHAMRKCKCSDPRDRIYTAQVFGIYLRPEIYLSPDYTKSTKDVYVEWTVNYVTSCNDLDILNYAGGCELPGLPTWVPDWTVATHPGRISHLRASSAARSVITELRGNVIKMKGIRITSVLSAARSSMSTGKNEREILEIVSQALKSFVAEAIEDEDRSQIDRLCRVLAMNTFQDMRVDLSRQYGYFKDCTALLRDCLGIERSELSAEDRWYARHSLAMHSSKRCIFKGGNGGFGLGPHGTRAGDIVAILLGLDSGMVLRPSDDNSYQVVGTAYFEGSMNGEAVLGPLSAAFEPV